MEKAVGQAHPEGISEKKVYLVPFLKEFLLLPANERPQIGWKRRGTNF